MARHRLSAEAHEPVLVQLSCGAFGLATTLVDVALARRGWIRTAAARGLSLAAIVSLVLAAAEAATAPRYSTPTAAANGSQIAPVAAVSTADAIPAVVAGISCRTASTSRPPKRPIRRLM